MSKEKGLEDADIKWDDLEGFSLKMNISPAEVVMRYLGEDIKSLDIEDVGKTYALIEKQAKTALDVIKLSKESGGESGGNATFVLKGVELSN